MLTPRTDRPANPRRLRGKRAASVVVEFALIAPFLASCIMGICELGRAMMVRQILNDSARIGCRSAALPNRANSDVTADVNETLSDNGIDTTQATITVQVNGVTANASTAVKGDKISVKVSIPFSSVSWTPPIFLTGNSVESETLVMQREG